ncbi:hypothetical protein EBR66_00955 [bacterium]|nr:hypothetical protein [bacterium]
MDWNQFVHHVRTCRENPHLAPITLSNTVNVEDITKARILHRAITTSSEKSVQEISDRPDVSELWSWVIRLGMERAALITCLVGRT